MHNFNWHKICLIILPKNNAFAKIYLPFLFTKSTLKYKKYIRRIFVGLLCCILALILSVFILFAFYKKELTANLITNLKKQNGLILKVEDIDVSIFSSWPNAAIELNDITLSDSISVDQPFLKAGSIALALDISKLIRKQFIIESVFIKDADLDLIKEKDKTNFQFSVNKTDTTGTAVKFEIKKISIKNTQFNFADKERGQHIDILFKENVARLKHQVDGIEAGFEGETKIGGLLFKQNKGAFLKNTNASMSLHVSIFSNQKTIFVHSPSSITINNHPYNVSSFIDLENKKQLLLNIDSRNINYNNGVALLNQSLQKKLSNFNVNGDVDGKIMIIASLGAKQEPILIANLSGRKNNITIGNSKIPYSNVSFKGSIISLDSSKQMGNTETAKIEFREIKGNVYDFPFTASVTVNNFDEAYIKIKADLFINASKIRSKATDEFILKGNCVAKIKYEGPAKKLNKEEFLNAPMKLNAAMFFNALSYQQINKPYIYTIDGNANLINKNLQFENLLLKTEAGNVTLKGNINGFASYVLGYSDGFKTKLLASSESINLNPYLLTVNKVKQSNKAAYKKAIKAEQSNFEFDVVLQAKKLAMRNVKATNATINLVHKNKLLDIRSVDMNACGGKLVASGTILDLTKINANVKIENMDVNKLFDEFENFGQKAIVSENLQGRIFVETKFKTDLDNKMEVIGNTLKGEVKLKLKDGHLVNYKPIQNISDYIFRNRDFKDVSFSEINETCTINGFEMQIREMEVASSVLDLYVSGNYNFKNESNINLIIPWSNLKKRGKDYIPKTSGKSFDDAKGLKLNYSGLPKKMKLSLGHK